MTVNGIQPNLGVTMSHGAGASNVANTGDSPDASAGAGTDATDAVSELSSADSTKFRAFLADYAKQTGGSNELSQFLQSSGDLDFTNKLAKGVDSEYNRTNNHVQLSSSIANQALNSFKKLDSSGLLNTDGTLKANAFTDGKQALQGVSHLDSLAVHEFHHYQDHQSGADNNASTLATTILNGNWGPKSDTGGYKRSLVDAAVKATDMTTGAYAGHKTAGDRGNKITMRILREYAPQLEQEKYEANLAAKGIIKPEDVEHLVTDGRGNALSEDQAMTNLFANATKDNGTTEVLPGNDAAASNGTGGLTQATSTTGVADMGDDDGDWHRKNNG